VTWRTGTTPMHWARCKVCGALYSSYSVDIVADGMEAHEREVRHG
jgi:hypothetical protein